MIEVIVVLLGWFFNYNALKLAMVSSVKTSVSLLIKQSERLQDSKAGADNLAQKKGERQ